MSRSAKSLIPRWVSSWESFYSQADEFIDSRVGFLVEIVDNEIDSLSNSINSLEQRLKTGEMDKVANNKRNFQGLVYLTFHRSGCY